MQHPDLPKFHPCFPLQVEILVGFYSTCVLVHLVEESHDGDDR